MTLSPSLPKNNPQADSPGQGLAISIGDPCGVGPELAVLALGRCQDPSLEARLHCHGAILEDACQRLSRAGQGEAAESFRRRLGGPFQALPPALPLTGLPPKGHPTDPWHSYALASLEAATDDLLAGRALALVTAPINKRSFHLAGLGLLGHTEYLALRCGRPLSEVVMLLQGPRLRVVPLTRHLPLAEVCPEVGLALLEKNLRPLVPWLHLQGLARPRIALACVDPHCGEWGLMGTLDLQLREKLGPRADFELLGPLAADTLFTPQRLATLDAVLCWYHDQAMIPVKMLDFDQTVNVTLGLPFLRCSPDHGPAYDLAAAGSADGGSMMASVELAKIYGGALSSGSVRA